MHVHPIVYAELARQRRLELLRDGAEPPVAPRKPEPRPAAPERKRVPLLRLHPLRIRF